MSDDTIRDVAGKYVSLSFYYYRIEGDSIATEEGPHYHELALPFDQTERTHLILRIFGKAHEAGAYAVAVKHTPGCVFNEKFHLDEEPRYLGIEQSVAGDLDQYLNYLEKQAQRPDHEQEETQRRTVRARTPGWLSKLSECPPPPRPKLKYEYMNAVFLLTGRFKLADKPEWEPPEIIEVRFVYPSGPQAYEEMIQTFLTYLDSHEVKNWTLRLTVKRVFNYFEEISHGPPRSMPKKKKTVIRGRFENMFKEIEERLHLASFENPREAFWGCFIW